jgi:hypothetical protein
MYTNRMTVPSSWAYSILRIVAVGLLTVNSYGSDTTDFRWGHPITISLGSKPDFLAGEWRKNSDRAPVLSAMRLFDLDGLGPKMWEWVGPNEGLLVWNPTNKPEYQPTGRDLFGFYTWGRSWEDGLAALVSLDANQDKKLTGKELDNLWVWVDANSDAVVQMGELRELNHYGIDSLDLSFEADGKGGVWSSVGTKLTTGRVAPLLEWWSLGGMDRRTFEKYVQDTLANACVYQWEPEDEGDGTGGLVRYFIMADNTLAALTIPFEQAGKDEVVGLSLSYELQEDGTFLSRADMGDHWLENYLSVDVDGSLVGLTGEAPKKEGAAVKPPMTWTAKKVSGPDLPHLLDAAAVRALLE